MQFDEALNICTQFQQEHLLAHYHSLSSDKQVTLLQQIADLDFTLIKKLFAKTQQKIEPSSQNVKPFPSSTQDSQKNYQQIGQKAINQGSVAALLVAGGQGSRLGFNGPKGSYILDLAGKKKSIFQIHAEKLLSQSECAIPWLIMTSELNHQETIAFFEKNNFWQYPKSKIKFFQQGMLPALSEDGKVLLESTSQIARVPDGNGGCFKALAQSGNLEWLKEKNVQHLFVFGVDNILCPICDPTLTGFYLDSQKPSCSPTILKTNPDEKVGLFTLNSNRVQVSEYSDLEDSMRYAKDSQGRLLFNKASLAMHYFHLDSLAEIISQGLPYHTAFKAVPFINQDGILTKPSQPNAYKFEQFMFDIFPKLAGMSILEMQREDIFAPVKNQYGQDSPASATELYLTKNKNALAK